MNVTPSSSGSTSTIASLAGDNVDQSTILAEPLTTSLPEEGGDRHAASATELSLCVKSASTTLVEESESKSEPVPQSGWASLSKGAQRLAILGALAVFEALALSGIVETPARASLPPLLAWPVENAHLFLRALLVAAGVVGVILWQRSRVANLRIPNPKPFCVGCLVVNGVAFTITACGASALEFSGGLFTLGVTGLAACIMGLSLLFSSFKPSDVKAIFRQFRGPVAIGLACGLFITFASQQTTRLWEPLSKLTFAVVEILLKLSGEQVLSDSARGIIGTPAFRVWIAPSCSGYQGIGLVWIFVAVFSFVFRDTLKWPRTLWLFPIATAIVWLTNAIRIASLVLVGHHISPKVAVGGFHSVAGWIFFCAVALGVGAAAVASPFFSTTTKVRVEREKSQDNASPYLLPLLTLLAWTLVAQAFDDGFKNLYPAGVILVGGVLALNAKGLREHWCKPDIGWALLLGALVYLPWKLLEEPSVALHQEVAVGLAALGGWREVLWCIARAVGACVIIPIVEEIAFRGFLMRRIGNRNFTAAPLGKWSWIGVLVSTAAFAVLHGHLIGAAIAGLVYCYAVTRRGRLIDGIAAHAVTNGILCLEVLWTGSWEQWF